MASLPTVTDLPYHLPAETRGQLIELSKILRIPSHLVENGDGQVLEAMVSTILYRHMDQRQRMTAMSRIKSLPSRELQGKLVTRALDTAFVNPQWGLWSLSNDELVRDEAFHDAVDTFGGFMGITFSISGGKDVVKELLEKRKLTKGGVAMIIIWVAFSGNRSSLKSVHQEQDRRTHMKQSSYH